MTQLLLSLQLGKIIKTNKLTSHDRLIKCFSPIMKSQENNISSITNMIIETHHSGKNYYNYFDRIIKDYNKIP